jgi:hypothetical protein
MHILSFCDDLLAIAVDTFPLLFPPVGGSQVTESSYGGF